MEGDSEVKVVMVRRKAETALLEIRLAGDKEKVFQ